MMQFMERACDEIGFEASQGQGGFHHDLEVFLSHPEKPTEWQVERLLKQSVYEVTELVSPIFDRTCEKNRHPAFAAEKDDRDPGRNALSVAYDASRTSGTSRLFVRKYIDTSAGTGRAYEMLWRAQQLGIVTRGVPRILSCSQVGDVMTVVMEYIVGVTVASFVASLGPGVTAARFVIPALCETVHDLHTALPTPLIHRDLKPSNVIMRSGDPVVIDFGCARAWRSDAESDTTHVLTRCYAPPEQFGFGQTDARSDVYALGKMLFFCMTGENPPNQCSEKQCLSHGIPTVVSALIGRACSFDPALRPGSARGFGEEAEQVLSGLVQDEAAVDVGSAALGMHGDRELTPVTSSSRRGLFDRVPLWVGKAWNMAVCSTYAVVVIGSFMAVVQPNPRDAALPFWFLIVQYALFGGVGCGALCYLMLDRRRIYEAIPLLADLGFKKELACCAALLFGSILVPSVLAGVLGVS